MAKGWKNTVPLGQAGTGSAVIYGRSPVAQQYGQQLSDFRNRENQEALRQDQAARDLYKSYRDNELKASKGALWASELGKTEQEHLMQGGKYRTQGIDVYNPNPMDPNQVAASEAYLNDRRNIEAKRNYRDTIEKTYNEIINDIRKNGVENYNPEDIAALNDFISNVSLDEAYQNNIRIPEVRKIFRPDEALKGIKAITRQEVATEDGIKRDVKVIDRDATERSILARLSTVPGGEDYLRKITNDIPVQDVRRFPDTIEGNIEDIEAQYLGDPRFREQIAQDTGITSPSDPRFEILVSTIAQERLSAKNNVNQLLDNYVAVASQGENLYDKRTSDFSDENQRMARERLRLAQSSEARQLRGESSSTAPGSDLNISEDFSIPLGTRKADGTPNELQVKNYAPFPLSSRNISVNEGIDMRTGKQTKMKGSSNTYSVVGLADVPVVKNGDSKGQLQKALLPGLINSEPEKIAWERKVLVKDKDGRDFFVDIESIQEGLLTKEQKKQFESYKKIPKVSNGDNRPTINW